MNKARVINIVHNFTAIYLICGWIIPSQRQNLVLLLPTLQYQFLVNNNMCLLTQLENNYSLEKDKNNSYVGNKLKEYGIQMASSTRERLVSSAIYMSFLISYSLM
jgi:hypothetical protein